MNHLTEIMRTVPCVPLDYRGTDYLRAITHQFRGLYCQYRVPPTHPDHPVLAAVSPLPRRRLHLNQRPYLKP